jgi:hypothetical protein
MHHFDYIFDHLIALLLLEYKFAYLSGLGIVLINLDNGGKFDNFNSQRLGAFENCL